MCLQCTGWIFGEYIIHVLVMYLQCTCLVHHLLPPVLAVRRSIPGLPGRAVVYKGKCVDNADLESSGAGQFDNVELKHYLAASADEADS